MPRFNRLPSVVLAAFLLALTGEPAVSESNIPGFGMSSLSGTYLAGRHAGRERDMEAAAAYFGRALARDPDNPVLIERAFIHELSVGNMDRAEELAESVLDVNAEHRVGRIVLGLSAARDNRHEAAREHFASAAFTPLGELTSGLLTAWSIAQEGKLDEALDALDVLQSQDAFGNFRLMHTGLIAAHLGDHERAEQAFAEAHDRAGSSLRVVQAYGTFLERTGRGREAAEMYEQFLATSQRSPLIQAALDRVEEGRLPEPFITRATDGMAEAMFSLANVMMAEQSMDVALIYTQLALSLRPDFAVAQVLLGEIHEDAEHYERAIEAYETIPDDSPLWASAEIQIATNLDRLERFDEALARIDGLIAERPDYYDALVARGNLMRLHEKWDEAAESYARALDLIGTPERQHWTVVYFRAISYERAGKWALAEADFRTALELEPEHPSVLNYLGYSLVDQGLNLDEAMEMIEKAVELRPNDGYIVDSLGWAHYKLGDYEEAVKHLERAIGLSCGDHQCSSDPVINDHLGDAYWQVGRKIEARFQWSHARDNDPEPEDLATIERKLADGLTGEDTPEPVKKSAAESEKP
ncbi:MAG: tetratricopeptide repeat protein [Hyphomicrobiales bacterium]